MSMSVSKLPTQWALTLGKECELIHHGQTGFDWPSQQVVISKVSDIPKNKRTQKHQDILDQWTEMYNKLSIFQKISIIAGFDTAIKVYTGVDLTEDQTNTLKLIADITPQWAKGEAADYLMRAIADNQTDRKTLAALTDALMNAIDGDVKEDNKDKDKGKSKAKGVIKQFYMELTGGVDENPSA